MESATATEAQLSAEWTDPKRYLWLVGLIVPIIPFIAWGLVELTGLGILWWFGPLVVFGILPALDQLIGKDSDNPPDSAIKWLEQDRYYRWCTYLFLPLQYASLIFVAAQWANGGLSAVESLGLAFTVAMVGGIAINTAHELGHKRKSYERWLSKIALAQTGYGHFFIEHNRGHHVRVATPEDPASSRLGESFWEFLPRTISGSLSSAIHLERVRLERLEKGFWTISNDILNAWAMTLALFGGLVAVFGPAIMPWLVIQAVIGLSLLEVVNYLEHYGLLRRRTDDGRYERCAPEHSWNSNNVASNVFLYHLQRHSDHHANPIRRYQALRAYEDIPELPSGYATMIAAACVPPLWRRVMDGRVLAHYGGDASRANLLPRKRERLLARYGSGAPTEASTATAPGAGRWAYREGGGVGDRERGERSESEPATAHQCPGCGYTYADAEGAPREGFPAGTPWSEVEESWSCPDCGVRDKVDFEPVDERERERSVAAS